MLTNKWFKNLRTIKVTEFHKSIRLELLNPWSKYLCLPNMKNIAISKTKESRGNELNIFHKHIWNSHYRTTKWVKWFRNDLCHWNASCYPELQRWLGTVQSIWCIKYDRMSYFLNGELWPMQITGVNEDMLRLISQLRYIQDLVRCYSIYHTLNLAILSCWDQ